MSLCVKKAVIYARQRTCTSLFVHNNLRSSDRSKAIMTYDCNFIGLGSTRAGTVVFLSTMVTSAIMEVYLTGIVAGIAS